MDLPRWRPRQEQFTVQGEAHAWDAEVDRREPVTRWPDPGSWGHEGHLVPTELEMFHESPQRS
jgi:hypothetical protein